MAPAIGIRRSRPSPSAVIAVLLLMFPAHAFAQAGGATMPMTGDGGASRPIGDPMVSRITIQRTSEIAASIIAGGRPDGLAPSRLPRLRDALLGIGGEELTLQQQPLSPAELQRRIERQRIEADEAGDADADARRRPPRGPRPGMASRGLVDTTDLDEAAQIGEVQFMLGTGNSSLWPGSDGILDER